MLNDLELKLPLDLEYQNIIAVLNHQKTIYEKKFNFPPADINDLKTYIKNINKLLNIYHLSISMYEARDLLEKIRNDINLAHAALKEAIQSNDLQLARFVLNCHNLDTSFYRVRFSTYFHLHAAVEKNNLDMVKLILPNATTVMRVDQGRRPLGIAASQQSVEIAALLLARGADPNAADTQISYPFKSTATPLHHAVEAGNFPMIELLVENGADINALKIQNKTKEIFSFRYDRSIKETALDIASRQHDSNISDYLKAHDATSASCCPCYRI